MASKRMSLRQYAAHRGVSLRAVQKAIETGRIRKEKDGKIDPGKADIEWAKSTDPSKQRGPASASSSAEAYAHARAARETYNARLAQLNYEQRAGKLVDASMVRLRAFENARAVRDLLLNLPGRLAPELVGKTDQNQIFNLLTTEITRALGELTGMRDAEARASAAASVANAETIAAANPEDPEDEELEEE